MMEELLLKNNFQNIVSVDFLITVIFGNSPFFGVFHLKESDIVHSYYRKEPQLILFINIGYRSNNVLNMVMDPSNIFCLFS